MFGQGSIHTNDLPDKDRTTDNQIRDLSSKGNYIVVSKDYDFVISHLLQNVPPKLLLISTGNIKNRDLSSLISKNLDNLIKQFEFVNFIELTNSEIIYH
jgi:predicted nuclease of predicted toxin-antitoxin system